MSTYDADTVDKIRLHVLRELWVDLLRADGLNLAGLRHLRGVLDPESKTFLPSRAVNDLATAVDLRLAEVLGCPLSDIPGRGGVDYVPGEWA